MNLLSILIAISGLLVAIIGVLVPIYFERKRGGISGPKIIASFGGGIGKQKGDDVKRPIWICAFGIPNAMKDEVVVTIPVIVKNESDVALKNVTIFIYYPEKYALAKSDNPILTEIEKEGVDSDEKVKRKCSDYFHGLVRVSFQADHISPHSYLGLREPLVISKQDLKTGIDYDEGVFENIKPIQFKIQAQVFSENKKPVLFESVIILINSDSFDNLQESLRRPLELMLSKTTFNPFLNLKPGIHIFPWPSLWLFKKRFSKYSYMLSQISLGYAKVNGGTFMAEKLEDTISGYGDMTFFIPIRAGNPLIRLLRDWWSKF